MKGNVRKSFVLVVLVVSVMLVFAGVADTQGSETTGRSPDDPDADMLYALKMARDCQGEAYCMEVDMDLEDIEGVPYDCPDLEDGDEMFFIFRSYMEPATKVAPDDNELLYDQAIYFGAYFTGQ